MAVGDSILGSLKGESIDVACAPSGTADIRWRQPTPGVGLHSKQEGGTHYVDMAVQPWDVIRQNFTPEQIDGYHRGTAIAYIMRAGSKGDAAGDYKKAIHHLRELIDCL